MIRNGGRYASLILGAGALLWLAQHGIMPISNPFRPNEYLIQDTQIDTGMFDRLISRKDVILCLIWFFVTAGPTTTLPADFNTASNQINVIGNGAGGSGGSAGTSGTSCGCPSGGGC
jgi:hypothetical protein